MATIEHRLEVPDAPPAPDRSGAVAIWALLGVVAMAVAAQTWIRWVLSDSPRLLERGHDHREGSYWRSVSPLALGVSNLSMNFGRIEGL